MRRRCEQIESSMMIRASLLFACPLLAGLTLLACASDDTTPNPSTIDAGVDSASPVDSGMSHEDAAPHDAGHVDAASDTDAGVRCTKADFDAHDHTATNGVDITFPLVATPEQYTNNCSRVKVGQHVGIYGDFISHPIEPKGGTTPSFIPSKSTGDALNLNAPSTPGVFGFQCTNHPDMMFGAVEVVP